MEHALTQDRSYLCSGYKLSNILPVTADFTLFPVENESIQVKFSDMGAISPAHCRVQCKILFTWPTPVVWLILIYLMPRKPQFSQQQPNVKQSFYFTDMLKSGFHHNAEISAEPFFHHFCCLFAKTIITDADHRSANSCYKLLTDFVLLLAEREQLFFLEQLDSTGGLYCSFNESSACLWQNRKSCCCFYGINKRLFISNSKAEVALLVLVSGSSLLTDVS